MDRPSHGSGNRVSRLDVIFPAAVLLTPAVEAETGVKTTFVESVAEGADAERVIRKLASSGADVIFTYFAISTSRRLPEVNTTTACPGEIFSLRSTRTWDISPSVGACSRA